MEIECALGRDIEVSLEVTHGVSRAARIVWVGGGLYGCTFDKAISRSDLKKVEAASRVVWPQFTETNAGSHLRSLDWITEDDVTRLQVAAQTAESHAACVYYEQDVTRSLSATGRLQIIFALGVTTWAIIGSSVLLVS
jgi:hypothetical protein